MKLSSGEHQYIAQRANWYFDVSPNSIDDRGDSVVLTGDGLEDLNSAVAFVNRYPQVKIICEAGQAVNVASSGTIPLGSAFPKYTLIDVEDIYAIKDAYIAFYGSVAKPSLTGPAGWASRTQ